MSQTPGTDDCGGADDCGGVDDDDGVDDDGGAEDDGGANDEGEALAVNRVALICLLIFCIFRCTTRLTSCK